MDIQTVWELGATGKNVRIAIVDDGLKTDDTDLLIGTNSLTSPSPHIDFLGMDLDPAPSASAAKNHGTSVAGIAAAIGQNNLKIVGAAYDAALTGVRLIGEPVTFNDIALALMHNIEQPFITHIYNNSWGIATHNGDLFSANGIIESAIEAGTELGRFQRGAIYIFSAGNDALNEGNANYSTLTNSRYTIAVAATNYDGGESISSEPGANVLVSAPSSSIGGTSSSAPLVSGIVALMLEANPLLHWRDVQRVLAVTAEKNNTNDDDWLQNGAGYWVNHKYGFGTIDAEAAFTTALSWTNLEMELHSSSEFSPNLSIPDSGGGSVTVSMPMFNLPITDTETVLIAIDSNHTYWGDLDMKLISPDGTVSQLTEVHNSSGQQLLGGFTFSSVRHLGEDPSGTWELVVEDGESADTGLITSVYLDIFGTFSAEEKFYDGYQADDNDGDNDKLSGEVGDDVHLRRNGSDMNCGGDGADSIFCGHEL